MKGHSTHSDRISFVIQAPVNSFKWKWLVKFGPVAATVCSLSMLIAVPVMAQSSEHFIARTEQGETLRCQPNQPPALSQNVPISPSDPLPSHTRLMTTNSTLVICERPSIASSAQPLDGATDMLIKLIYLGLPGMVLVGISLRTLHLHRQLMRQRAFVESLERIWERSVSY